jgi:Uma2 family endonuclease
LQPDLLIVCQPINKSYLDFAPSLVVEILSPSTAMKDRNNKFNIYQQQEIPFYLIVDADKETIEIYALDAESKYQLEPFSPAVTFLFQLAQDCRAEVTLQNIWQ